MEENVMMVPAEQEVLTLEEIQKRIYVIRGVQVMLDRDLALCYGVKTGRVNEQMKRNQIRFPEDFVFQLTKEEVENLKSQNATSSWGGDRKLPYAYTEQGVSQLASVLKTPIAALMSVRIIRAFVAMRHFLVANAGIFQRLENMERNLIEYKADTDNKIEQILQRMDEQEPPMLPEQLFATGCVWDAYAYVCDLVRSAKSRIVLIDNFVDDRVLKILDKRSTGVSATVHTRYTEQFELDLAKHNEQCAPIERVQLPIHIHDRFLIVDDDVYLLGASVKDMGKGLCAITKVGFPAEQVLGLVK